MSLRMSRLLAFGGKSPHRRTAAGEIDSPPERLQPVPNSAGPGEETPLAVGGRQVQRLAVGRRDLVGTVQAAEQIGPGWPATGHSRSAVGVLGVARGCVDDPDCSVVIADHVVNAPAACDLVHPLLKVPTVVTRR